MYNRNNHHRSCTLCDGVYLRLCREIRLLQQITLSKQNFKGPFMDTRTGAQSLNWNHFMLKIFRISPCRATATAVCFMNRKSCQFALCFVYRIGLPCPTNYASSISEGPLSHLIFLTLSILYILLCVCCLRRSSTKRGQQGLVCRH